MIRDFLDGITSYQKAIQLISKLKLWGYILVPGIISFLLGGGILLTAWSLSDNVGDLLSSWYPWEIGRDIIQSVATVFGGLLVLAVGLIIFKHIVVVLTGPFMSPFSERIEKELLGETSKTKFNIRQVSSDLIRGLRIALRNIFRELFLTLILLILGLVPIFSPFTAIGLFILQAYYFGFGNMDFTMERHMKVKESVRFVKRHKGLAIGNGTVNLVLMMTVVGFIFVLPLAAAAATIETVKRLGLTANPQPVTEEFV